MRAKAPTVSTRPHPKWQSWHLSSSSLPHQPSYLHKCWVLWPVLQQLTDSLRETFKHRLAPPCLRDIGVLVEVIGPVRLHHQIQSCLSKKSVMGEGAGQKLTAQELVIQFNSCEVNKLLVKINKFSKLTYQQVTKISEMTN